MDTHSAASFILIHPSHPYILRSCHYNDIHPYFSLMLILLNQHDRIASIPLITLAYTSIHINNDGIIYTLYDTLVTITH
jgi:hypothetical protein